MDRLRQFAGGSSARFLRASFSARKLAALAAAGPPRSQDDIFGSCIDRLIDLAGLGPQEH
jgi:hypothetical protein